MTEMALTVGIMSRDRKGAGIRKRPKNRSVTVAARR
jgi:hypothetical protein